MGLSTEAAMPMEEKQTHLNLRKWMQENAASRGIKDTEEDEEEDEDDDEVMGMLAGADLPSGEDEADEPSEAAPAAKSEAKKGKKDEKKEEKKEEKQERNWSAVNLAHVDSKLPFKGAFSPVACTNWFWYRTIRPELLATKASLPDLDISAQFGLEAVEDVLGEYAPKLEEKKDKKDDKKDKKDDKNDKKKDDKKKAKDKISLNTEGKAKASNCIKKMILGERGWASWVKETNIEK